MRNSFDGVCTLQNVQDTGTLHLIPRLSNACARHSGNEHLAHTDYRRESIIENSLFSTRRLKNKPDSIPELVWILPYSTTLYCGSHLPCDPKTDRRLNHNLIRILSVGSIPLFRVFYKIKSGEKPTVNIKIIFSK